jgi:hypothetical protein
MPGQLDSDTPDLNDLAAVERWLAGLPADGEQRLAEIGGVLVRLGRPEFEPDALVGMLERIRFALLPTVDACLRPLEARQLPYGRDVWRMLGEVLTTMRALRTLYRRAASRISRQTEAGALAAGAAQSVAAAQAQADDADSPTRQALPLIRALDLQSRLLAALLVHRVMPLPEDWDELCALGRAVRETGLLDAQVPDVIAIVKPATARAMFVYPLLLRLAELPSRPRTDAGSAARFASRLAARIGFRIDTGAARANALGPVLLLTESCSVRLDTHRVPRVVAQRRQQALEAGASGHAAARLLDALERCWAPPADAAAARPFGRQQPAGRVMPGRLCFGLPRPDGALPGAAPGGRSAAGGREAGDRAYQFGQWERNTIVRLSMGGGERVSTGESASSGGAASDPMAGAEVVACRPASANRISIERRLLVPPVALGGLVALELPSAAAQPRPAAAAAVAGIDRPLLRLGIVAAIEQFPAPAYEKLRAHSLDVELWPGRGAAVEIRLGEARFFDQAWLLRTESPGEQASSELVTAAGLVAPGGVAMLREQGRERAIRFLRILARGPGFERVAFEAG